MFNGSIFVSVNYAAGCQLRSDVFCKVCNLLICAVNAIDDHIVDSIIGLVTIVYVESNVSLWFSHLVEGRNLRSGIV